MLIESMDHIVSTFDPHPNRTQHVSQVDFTELKVKLFFVVQIPKEDELFTNDEPFKIVSVRIPKFTPIYRVREFVNFTEKELNQIFKSAKRLPFVLTAPNGSNEWSFDLQIPFYRVAYA